MNILNTNARSIAPKMNSFVDAFVELDTTIGIVSETWLAAGEKLEEKKEDLLLGSGISLFVKNRQRNYLGVAHGGIAIAVRDSVTKMSEFPFHNPENYEIIAVAGTIMGISRKFFIIGAYIPPGYDVAKGKGCLQVINDIVLNIKSSFSDPLICVAGDFNQWLISEALEDYPDMVEVQTPDTRGGRRIEKIFINWHDMIVEQGCVPPLQTEPDKNGDFTASDHRIQFMKSTLPRREPVVWEKYNYRPFTEAGAVSFGTDLAAVDWSPVMSSVGPDRKAAAFQVVLDSLMDKHFPIKVRRKKASDLPWLNDTAKKKIKKKKAVYKAEGKSERWTALRDALDAYLATRQEVFLQNQRTKFTGPEAKKNFYKNVKHYRNAEKPKDFSVKDIMPGKPEGVVANEVANYFNKISSEFQPLTDDQIPSTYHRDLPRLSVGEVEKRLKAARKPNSRVKGDLFPALINRNAAYLAVPLAAIYNDMIRTNEWPAEWKREYVTTIPKKKLPEGLGDLRNISCTLFFSKVFESYLLQCALEEISLKENQFGGVKGCSTTHMMIELLQEMCDNAEDYRSATVLTAIDYAKAFNRLSFQHCLAAFQKKGSSTPVIRLLASFLSDRTMTVRVGQSWSDPLNINGGCPQGSILGVFLFNITTEDLEEKYEKFESELHDTGDQIVTFLNTARNVPLINPPVERPVGTQTLTTKKLQIRKYVDDNVSCEKLNFATEIAYRDARGVEIKRKRAPRSQNGFLSVTAAAVEKGMVVNENKTQILCVSDALSYTPVAFITDSRGQEIESQEQMKILGFQLCNRPTMSYHVAEIVKKMRMKYWSLRHLAKIGFTQNELVEVYKSVILPIADYGAPAYHSMLSDEQDYDLERAQVGTLRSIFGSGISGRKLREKAGVKTLRQRRIEQTDKFAQSCLKSERFRGWFPLRQEKRETRNTEKYQEFYARCERLRNSPLYYMRRRLNGKEGKTYGQRYHMYRE